MILPSIAETHPRLGRPQIGDRDMLMSNNVARMRIARELREAELAVDEALLKQSALLSTLVRARQDAGVSPFTGHDALLRLSKSQLTLLSAGGELARVHASLLKIQQDVLGYEACPANVPMLADDKAAA
jgi:hypothetical protein